MLTWHIVLRYMKVKRDILRQNLELVCWAKFRNDISQKYIVPENFNLKNFPGEACARDSLENCAVRSPDGC